jgi:DNA-binding GntR family transcriptional regulator
MTKKRLAYDLIKEKIFARVLIPGQFVTQAELVKLLGVSIGPLREAIQQLMWEELVLVIPQRGIQIVQTNVKQVREAFQLRKILEKEAVRNFIKNASDEKVFLLENAIDKIVKRSQAAKEDETLLIDVLNVDFGFHETIINELRNDLISQVFKRNFDKIRIAWLESAYTYEIVDPAMKEHILILKAIKKRDTKEAEITIEDHLDISLKRIMGV